MFKLSKLEEYHLLHLAKHSSEKCMECSKKPEYEVLWAEGRGHAWFCKKHFKEWATKGDGKGDICSVKEVTDGKVKKWKDNTNKNIWDSLKKELNLKE
jgi:hypothetical protein